MTHWADHVRTLDDAERDLRTQWERAERLEGEVRRLKMALTAAGVSEHLVEAIARG